MCVRGLFITHNNKTTLQMYNVFLLRRKPLHALEFHRACICCLYDMKIIPSNMYKIGNAITKLMEKM